MNVDIVCHLVVCVHVSFVSTDYMYHEYDWWTDDADIKRRRRHFTNFRFWACFGMTHVDTKFEQGYGRSKSASMCMGECDFHVNWLHVSRIWPTHWRL